MSSSPPGLHRRLSAGDVEDLRDLLRICWIDTYTGILPEPVIDTAIQEWQSKKSLLGGILNPRGYYAGCFVGGGLVGMVSAGRIARETVKICQLSVHPGRQREGVVK